MKNIKMLSIRNKISVRSELYHLLHDNMNNDLVDNITDYFQETWVNFSLEFFENVYLKNKRDFN